MKEIDYDGPSLLEESEQKNNILQHAKDSKIPVLRTFRADMQELIKTEGVTKTSIALAEAKRREDRGESRFPKDESDSHLGRIIFILLLIFAFGLGIGIYALVGVKLPFSFMETATTTAEKVTTEDAIIDLSHSPREQVLADIIIAFGNTSLPPGEKRNVKFMITYPNEGMHAANFSEFFTAVVATPASDALLSSLNPSFTYDIYSGTIMSGVITLHSRSYANTFAGLLDWEPKMAENLIPLLRPSYYRKNIVTLRERLFHDEKIGEFNARVLTDAEGADLLAYAFVDKKTLVLAGSKDVLTLVFKNFVKQ